MAGAISAGVVVHSTFVIGCSEVTSVMSLVGTRVVIPVFSSTVVATAGASGCAHAVSFSLLVPGRQMQVLVPLR